MLTSDRANIPKYRRHKGSGQAVVTLDGRDHYLGKWNTADSRREYRRLVAEWLAGGTVDPAGSADLTVAELIGRYRAYALRYYRKGGKPTATIPKIAAAAKAVRTLYGHTRAAEFGPLALKAVRQTWIDAGNARSYVNDLTGWVRRMFRWAAGEQLLPFDVAQSLHAVDGLRRGRTEARETAPVGPVDDATIDETLPHLPPIVADMVRLQRLTGMRPDEVCSLRPCDMSTAGDVWEYRPARHKTQHRGRERIIFIGPQGQGILRRYPLRDTAAYCSCPLEGERRRRERLTANRKTPLSCGNRPGTNRRKRPQLKPGDCYTTASYRRAIHRACDRAFPAPGGLTGANLTAWRKRHRWSPNRLRHAAATEIRKRFGLEAAQVTLGHAAADVTQIYAERDMELAARVMREVG